MNQKNISLIILALVICSCTVPKDARKLKRATKDWRKAEEVLWAYSDSPLGATTLILRENNKFELTSSGFFMVWFEAGTWTYKQDTVKLSFVDRQQIVNKTQNAYVSGQNYRIYFQEGDTTGLTLRILLNKLEKP